MLRASTEFQYSEQMKQAEWALQISGAYKSLTLSSAPSTASISQGTTGMSEAMLMRIVYQLEQNNARMEDIASRPINNSYFALQETLDLVAHIKTVTKL